MMKTESRPVLSQYSRTAPEWSEFDNGAGKTNVIQAPGEIHEYKLEIKRSKRRTNSP